MGIICLKIKLERPRPGMSGPGSGAPEVRCALIPKARHGSAHSPTLGLVPPGMEIGRYWRYPPM